jgi:hypothetical protein
MWRRDILFYFSHFSIMKSNAKLEIQNTAMLMSLDQYSTSRLILYSYLNFPCKIYFDSSCLLTVQYLIAVCLLFSLFWNIWAFTSSCPATGSSNGSLQRWVKTFGCKPYLVSKGWGDTFFSQSEYYLHSACKYNEGIQLYLQLFWGLS